VLEKLLLPLSSCGLVANAYHQQALVICSVCVSAYEGRRCSRHRYLAITSSGDMGEPTLCPTTVMIYIMRCALL